MDKVQFIAAVREHITKGETDKALALALQWLSTSPEADNSWLDNVRSLNAQFERTRREQQRRIISYEQAQLNLNQTNHYLLEAMEGLEDGRRAPAETPDATQQTPTRRLTWLYALLGVAAVTIAAIFVVPGLLNSGSGTDDTVDDQPDEQPVSTCPSFDEQSDFNIMLLPFKPPSDGNNLDIHTTLQLRLAEYSDRYDLPASVLIGNVDLKDVNNYPTNGRDAERIGRPCHANLIIWGHIFKEMDGSNLVRTSYHLLDKDYFTLTDYELNEEAELDTLTSLSSIITDGTLSRGIEHALLAIFGMVAHETEHYAAAVEVFEDLQQSTPPEEQDPQIGMLLADSYVRLQQTDRALPILNQLIDQDRDNLDAVTMRGNILFEQGQYDEAVADLDRAIAADPEDGNLRTKRAAANIRTSRLDLAREDLEYVQRSDTDQRAINKINTEYQARASIERSRLQDAEQRIERNPRDTSALRIKAEAARNLGDYEISKQAAASLLQVEPSSAFGLATLMEIKPQLQDTHSVNRLIESVRTRITNEELLKAAPRLRTSSQLQNIQIRQ